MPSRRSPRPEKCWAAVAVSSGRPTRWLLRPVQLDDPLGGYAPAVEVRADAQRHQERRGLRRPAPGRSPCRGGRSGRGRSGSASTGGQLVEAYRRLVQPARADQPRTASSGRSTPGRAAPGAPRSRPAREAWPYQTTFSSRSASVGRARRRAHQRHRAGWAGASACRRAARGAGCGRGSRDHRAGAAGLWKVPSRNCGERAARSRPGAGEPAAELRRHVPRRPGQRRPAAASPASRHSRRPSARSGRPLRCSPISFPPPCPAVHGSHAPGRRRAARAHGHRRPHRRTPTVAAVPPTRGRTRGTRSGSQPPRTAAPAGFGVKTMPSVRRRPAGHLARPAASTVRRARRRRRAGR